MKLIHSIASYTGISRRNMEQILNDEAKEVIVKITEEPEFARQTDGALLSELVEMDIFYISDGGTYKPNTAIFLKNDIEYLTDIVFSLSDDMSKMLQETVKDFTITSPNIKNFIYAIIAMGQGLHASMKNLGAASSWQSKTGKYEKSRVDFNEDCAAYHAFGKDLQNKNITKGRNYTSATIGYDFNSFDAFCFSGQLSGNEKKFMNCLSLGLIDLFPLLILGQVENEELKEAARIANIDVDDRFSVITYDQSKEYQFYIDKISDVCSDYYLGKINYIQDALLSTTSGRGGAPVKNMMMNFWRYMRKAIAKKLYDDGFLTDRIPQDGSFTIFCDNRAGYFN